MISEDQYRGRQLFLSRNFDDVSIEKLSMGDRANVSRAIAMYDTLGLYLRRGYLIEKDVIEMWGNPHIGHGARLSRSLNVERGSLDFPLIRIFVIWVFDLSRVGFAACLRCVTGSRIGRQHPRGEDGRRIVI
jgi:hypothetical protein